MAKNWSLYSASNDALNSVHANQTSMFRVFDLSHTAKRILWSGRNRTAYLYSLSDCICTYVKKDFSVFQIFIFSHPSQKNYKMTENDHHTCTLYQTNFWTVCIWKRKDYDGLLLRLCNPAVGKMRTCRNRLPYSLSNYIFEQCVRDKDAVFHTTQLFLHWQVKITVLPFWLLMMIYVQCSIYPAIFCMCVWSA